MQQTHRRCAFPCSCRACNQEREGIYKKCNPETALVALFLFPQPHAYPCRALHAKIQPNPWDETDGRYLPWYVKDFMVDWLRGELHNGREHWMKMTGDARNVSKCNYLLHMADAFYGLNVGQLQRVLAMLVSKNVHDRELKQLFFEKHLIGTKEAQLQRILQEKNNGAAKAKEETKCEHEHPKTLIGLQVEAPTFHERGSDDCCCECCVLKLPLATSEHEQDCIQRQMDSNRRWLRQFNKLGMAVENHVQWRLMCSRSVG
jgi:hypothetical protein